MSLEVPIACWVSLTVLQPLSLSVFLWEVEQTVHTWVGGFEDSMKKWKYTLQVLCLTSSTLKALKKWWLWLLLLWLLVWLFSSFICKKVYSFIQHWTRFQGSSGEQDRQDACKPGSHFQRQRHRQQSGEEMNEEYDFRWGEVLWRKTRQCTGEWLEMQNYYRFYNHRSFHWKKITFVLKTQWQKRNRENWGRERQAWKTAGAKALR